MRTCQRDGCTNSLEGKRSHAVYCSKVCKMAAWHSAHRTEQRDYHRKRQGWQGREPRPHYIDHIGTAFAWYIEHGYIEVSPEGCWLWLGTLSRGYGQVGWQGTVQHTHRWLYGYMVGPIPEGHHLHHECETPPCMRPSHLTPLTPDEHAARHNDAARYALAV